jgi:hypothetical protein
MKVHFLPLVIALFLPATMAWAGTTADFWVTAEDKNGKRLTQVELVLRSEHFGYERRGETGPEGRHRFAATPPGIFEVEARAPGHHTTRVQHVHIEPDAVANLVITLKPLGSESAVASAPRTENGSANRVDPTRVAAGITIEKSLTDRLPTPRDPMALSILAPGVWMPQHGGRNPVIHGGGHQTNAVSLDGLRVGDPTGGGVGTRFAFDGIDHIQIRTAGLDAEHGNLSGGLIQLFTASGGDAFALDAGAYVFPSTLTLREDREGQNIEHRDFNVRVGGPIIRRKLWFSVAGQYREEQTRTDASLRPESAVDLGPIPTRFEQGMVLDGKLDWRPTAWQEVAFLLHGDPQWTTNALQDPRVHPDAERQAFDGGSLVALRTRTWLLENLIWENHFSYRGAQNQWFPMAGCDTEACPDAPPARVDLATGVIFDNDLQYFDTIRYQGQWHSTLAYYLDTLWGTHLFKAGFDGRLDVVVNEETIPGGQILYQGERVEDDFLVEMTASRAQTLRGDMAAIYLQDRWRITPNLTLRPGLRFDSARLVRADGEALTNFNVVTPRFGLAWDPFGLRRTTLRMGYYQYADLGLLAYAEAASPGMATRTLGRDPQSGQFDVVIAENSGAPRVSPDAELNAPITHEALFGLTHQIDRNLAGSVDFLLRQKNGVFEDEEINVIWNDEGNRPTGFENGNAEEVRILATRAEAFKNHLAMDLALHRILADHWQILATYTLSLSRGTAEEMLTRAFDNPRQRFFEEGALTEDIRHRARISASVDLPGGFQVGGTFSHLTGRPADRFFWNSLAADFVDRRAPRGMDPVNLADPDDDVAIRLPDQTSVDARLTWRLRSITGQDLWLVADLFNLLNARTALEIEERNLPAVSAQPWGTPTRVQEPFRVRLGLRYLF